MGVDLLNYIRTNFYHKKANILLAILLVIDFACIISHLYFKLQGFDDYRSFMVDTEGGYPEYVQYCKYVLIVIFCAYLVFKGNINYLSWALFFMVLGFDDAFVIHERVGAFLADTFNFGPAIGLRAIDFGELAYSVLAGIMLFGLIGLFYYKGTRLYRDSFWDIVLLIGVLLFFAIGIDMLHSMFSGTNISGIFGLVEDGGEMIALSLLVWYFYFIVLTLSQKRAYLYSFFISRYR